MHRGLIRPGLDLGRQHPGSHGGRQDLLAGPIRLPERVPEVRARMPPMGLAEVTLDLRLGPPRGA